MPNYKGHLVGGSVAFLIMRACLASFHPSFTTSMEWLLCALVGSLFPDVDITSKGQKLFARILAAVFLLCMVQQRIDGMALVGGLAFLPLLARHRGLFHRVWFLALIASCCYGGMLLIMPHYIGIFGWDLIFFFIGAVSHILLDRGVHITRKAS